MVPYALMLVAQVVTMAALGRAAWLAFFRRRAEEYELREEMRPGMLAGLVTLGGCCIAFGVAGSAVLRRLMAPAAASLLNPARYAAGVLTTSARLPPLHIPFDYVSPTELISVSASVAVAAALAWAYLRIREPLVIRVLRALHTGSANDYAAYAVVGLLAVICVLSIG
jgi:multicomponent Na+:H+ antiporter subunit D